LLPHRFHHPAFRREPRAPGRIEQGNLGIRRSHLRGRRIDLYPVRTRPCEMNGIIHERRIRPRARGEDSCHHAQSHQSSDHTRYRKEWRRAMRLQVSKAYEPPAEVAITLSAFARISRVNWTG